MDADTVWSVAWGSLIQPESELMLPAAQSAPAQSAQSQSAPAQSQSAPAQSAPAQSQPCNEADTVWNAHCSLLARYVAERRELPKVRTVYEGAYLGGWVSRQRRHYWTNRRFLTAERRAALEAIDGWEWGVPSRNRWWQMYELLRGYVAEHGVLPGARVVYGGRGLGKWVCNQRSCSRVRRALKPERVQALEAVRGWRWETRTSQMWHHYYWLLQDYVQDRGELPAPGKRWREGARLGNWVLRQRALGEALPQAHYDALDAVEGWRW